jgi:hypothetical protein
VAFVAQPSGRIALCNKRARRWGELVERRGELGLAFVASSFQYGRVFNNWHYNSITAHIQNKVKTSSLSKKGMRLSDLFLFVEPAVMLQSRLMKGI